MSKRSVSDRGEQMRHRATNLHQRHMSDIRGAVGCYYCWLGQYSKCTSTCHLVRVTDRDHELAATGGAADHRDVLHRWDHSAPVLTHAAQQAQSFYDIEPPKEAKIWVQSAAGIGGRHFYDKRDFISVTRHVPEQKPWITASRAEDNRNMLKAISRNIHQSEIDRIERSRQKHEKKLFSLLLPEQFIPPYKYPHGSVTVQATPYTQIAMKQPRSRTPTTSSSTSKQQQQQQYSFNDEYLDTLAEARAGATEQRRRTNNLFRGTNRPVFMHNSHGGRFVAANSSIFGGGNVKQTNFFANNNDTPAKQLQRAEEDFHAAQNGGGVGMMLSTAEQLRAALEGRSIAQLKEERLQQVRARSAGAGGVRGNYRTEPSVKMAETAGQVLSGRYTNAMAMPMPDSFSF